ncbi:MAG: hypothetical protein IPN04_10665 [Rhodoferax sp.]|nr:hypothetical protein [Rhodoferax sp.]
MFLPALAVLGIPWQMLVIVGLIDLLYQYWCLPRLIGRMGVLDRILVTPSNHRVHHGQNDYCIDKNYGGIPVLLGPSVRTFADERDDEKICCGIRKPLHSFSPIGNLHFTPTCGRCPVRPKGWRAKLGVWVAPPGGWTDEPIEHFEPRTFTRFDVQTPRRCVGTWRCSPRCWCLLFRISSVWPGPGQRHGRGARVGHLITAVALGALLERFVWGKWLEQVRLLALGCVVRRPCRSGLGLRRRCCSRCVAGVVCGQCGLAESPGHCPLQRSGSGSMNQDALSDLVLLLVCAAILWFHLRQRPAVAVAASLIGLAASLGVCCGIRAGPRCWGHTVSPACWPPVLRFRCPHQACAGRMRRWPHVARQRSGVFAGRGGVGIVLTLAGLALWSQVVPGVCAGDCLDGGAAAQYGAWRHAGFCWARFVVAATGKANSNYLACSTPCN